MNQSQDLSNFYKYHTCSYFSIGSKGKKMKQKTKILVGLIIGSIIWTTFSINEIIFHSPLPWFNEKYVIGVVALWTPVQVILLVVIVWLLFSKQEQFI